MRRQLFTALFGLFLCVGSSLAFEAVGTFKKVDIEKNTLFLHANGQDRTVRLTADVKVLGADGKPLADGLKAKELKDGAAITVTVEPVDGAPSITAIRLGGRPGQAKKGGGKADPTMVPRATTGLKPLSDMTAADKYKGEDGGLYGGGKNEPTGAHAASARQETAKIVPLDKDGQPAKDGKIGLVSISMSNATMEYSTFKQIADKDPAKSPLVSIVDCAQGGQAMAQWVNPKAKAWQVADTRLEQAQLNPKQVQVVWVKLANVGPTGDLIEHGKKLQKDTLVVLQNAKERFPNLRIAYLSSRIYAGYATTKLNPEPFAYESAFACRWLIQDQAKGDGELNFDAARGAVKAPLLLWGPYLWADGTSARKGDSLIWEKYDLTERDGTHPSDAGRKKVADMLLKFFKTDPNASTWFVKK